MIDDAVLVDDWHPVATARQLVLRRPIGARLLGEDIVVWQADGRPIAWQDLCVHRGTRLSLGRVEGCTLQCPYHGWVSDRRLVSMPARNWWDFAYRKENLPDSIIVDERPRAAPGRFWWSGNNSEVGVFLTGYESAWLPDSLLDPEHRDRLADALFAASRLFATTLHFNKGLAGATEERRTEARETSIQPAAIDAFALAIIASGQPHAYPGVSGHEPDWTAARADAERIAAALGELRKVAPDSGSYSSEMSFFEKNWREAAWGPHYDRLLATKQKYDPDGLFTGHHQVGSEFWSADGFTRLG